MSSHTAFTKHEYGEIVIYSLIHLKNIYSLPSSTKASCKAPSGTEYHVEISEPVKSLLTHVGVNPTLYTRIERGCDSVFLCKTYRIKR